MKHVFKVAISLALTLCMLLGAFSASAALWDFSNGIPDGWERQDMLDEVKADHINAPVNPNASQEAKNLLAYLQIVGDSNQFVGGQFDINDDDTMMDQIIADYGYTPALYSARYTVDVSDPKWAMDGDKETTVLADNNKAMDFTNVTVTNEHFKKYYDMGAVLLVHSDSAPRSLCADAVLKNKPDEYFDATDAVKELDQTNPDRDMQAYALWMRYQEHVIESLQALEASGVNAYLWRPWIEYNLHTFAGRTGEGYDAFVRVFQQTVNMLVDAGLKGFLVCFSPAGGYSDVITHNPGTNYVDTYSFTVYSDSGMLGYLPGTQINSSNLSLIRQSGKPLGFSEYSCRTGNWQKVSEQARASSYDLLHTTMSYWPQLSWVNFWGNGSYSSVNNNGGQLGNDDGMLYWSSDFVLTLDEIVDYRNTKVDFAGIAQLFTAADASSSYVGLEEKNYTAADLKALGLDASKVRALRLNRGFAVQFWTNADCTGDVYSYAFSTKNISEDVAKNFKSVSITSLQNVALNKEGIYGSVSDDEAWRANDGAASMWQGNVFDPDNKAEQGTAWLLIDLGKAYHVGRYVLKNASFASHAAIYNSVDFQLQYSNNGRDWTTVDTVTGNKMGQVDRSFNAVMARYFRLLITDPNECTADTEIGTVSVAEIELYGVDPGLLSDLVATEDADLRDDDEAQGDDFDYTDDDYVTEGDDEEESEEEADEEEDEDKKPVRKPVKTTTVVSFIPWWIWLIVAGGVVIAGGAALVIVLIKRKKRAS